MPEGDTLFRTARRLHQALAGRTVTRVESVFPRLTRVGADEPLPGRTVDRVEARGKHLLIHFSGGLVLHTHMRMHGSWHVYRPGERWQRPRHDMRIVLGTEAFEAVAFSVPVAELLSADDLDRSPALRDLGPDVLSDAFDAAEAGSRVEARGHMEIGDALMDQTAIAGIGNIYKSEILFAGRVHPFLRVSDMPRDQIEALLAMAVRVMRASAGGAAAWPAAIEAPSTVRRTGGPAPPPRTLRVYGRAGKPCRRCGTPISWRRSGPNARSTYWCGRCQPAGSPEP